MEMSQADIAALDARAQEVGAKLGWQLRFVVAPNPEFVGLVAGPDQVFVVGPSALTDLAAHDVDLTLDSLERGDQELFADEDCDPRLGGPPRK